MKRKLIYIFFLVFIYSFTAMAQVDPDTASKVSIDRFSADAGHLFVRDSEPIMLPGPNVPIDFDIEPFLYKRAMGLMENIISYYNFDAQPTIPAPIFVSV